MISGYSDQSDIFNPEEWGWPVHIIGLGSIGSTVLLPLLKLGINDVHLWDDDIVEPKNLPYQLMSGPDDVGKTKVAACAEAIRRLRFDVEVTTHEARVDQSTRLRGVVICCVDRMDKRAKGRSAIFEAVRGRATVPLFMDGRIAGETVHLYSFDPVDPERCDDYSTTLYADADSSPESCHERNIIYSPLQLATWMSLELARFSRGEMPNFCLMAGLRHMQYS